MNSPSTKVTTLTAFERETTDLFLGHDVSLCFGLFNLLHPGHLRYFQTAKQYGTKLVVALRGDNMLSDLERRECFPDIERAKAVAALELIDNVIILDNGGLENLVSLIKPTTLVLGREFEKERSLEVYEAVDRLKRFGGRVVYEAGEIHYATSDLLFAPQDEIEGGRSKQFKSALLAQDIQLDVILSHIEDDPRPKILVIGDTIVDRYVACDPVGMSNEAPVIVVKELESKDFIGGAGIVAAHVSALGGDCYYLSITGNDSHAHFVEERLADYNVTADLIEDKSRPTTSKIRYMVENQKLFRVSRLKEHRLSPDLENILVNKIKDLSTSIDAIIVSDFVYGVITNKILDVLEQVSRQRQIPLYGDLQCSSQVGDISKFKDFKLLCPTEREARIALSNQDDGVEYVSKLLMSQTRCTNLVLKLGADGFIAYSRDLTNDFVYRQHFPALTINPVDVAGAGDSLLASIAVGLSRGLSLMEASALGSCVAALTVQSLGNIPVDYRSVRVFAEQQGLIPNAI